MSALWIGLVGLAVVLAYILGRARGVHATRLKPPPDPPRPICGCGDHLSLHDPRTGKCHHAYDLEDQCQCRQYVGPIPDGAMILPPTLPPPVVTS